MRILLLVGLACLVLASGPTDAEARGGRIRFGGWRTHGPAPAPGLAIRPRSDARPTYVVLPSPGPRVEPAEGRAATASALPPRSEQTAAPESPASVAPKPVAAAEPWCRSGTVVGTGAGFCMVN